MKVRGTQNFVKDIEIGVDTVYVRTNILLIDETDFKGWEYDEVQYKKNRYIELMSEKNQTLESCLDRLELIVLENEGVI